MKKILAISSIILFISGCGRSVEDLGVFGSSRRLHVLGQDGVTPISLNDSITLWTFGDTILGTWRRDVPASATFKQSTDITGMIPNSLAFTEAPTAESIRDIKFIFLKKNGEVSQFIEYKKGEDPKAVRLWAVDGIRIGDRVFVYYFIVKSSGKNSFSMKGIGIASWIIPEDWKIGDAVDFKRLPDVFPSGYPAFGAAVLEMNDCIYTAGQFISKDKTSPIKIARVKKIEIENGSSYEFLTGDGSWVRDINKADAFLGDVMGECSLSYNEYIDEFVIIYCQSWTGRIIMVSFSDFVKLKNAKKQVVYEPPKLFEDVSTPKWYYSGKEIFSSGRSIYMIYINPLEYQPYLLKINLGFDITGFFNMSSHPAIPMHNKTR